MGFYVLSSTFYVKKHDISQGKLFDWTFISDDMYLTQNIEHRTKKAGRKPAFCLFSLLLPFSPDQPGLLFPVGFKPVREEVVEFLKKFRPSGLEI